MLQSLSTNQQHNQYNEQNITDAVIPFKPIRFKGLFDSRMDLVQSKIVIDQTQSTVGSHVLTNETDGQYFISSCNQRAFFVSHLYKPFWIWVLGFVTLSIPLSERLFQFYMTIITNFFRSFEVITSLKTGSSSPPPIIHNRNSGFCIGFTELSKNEIEVENHFYKFFDITDSKKFLTFNGTTK